MKNIIKKKINMSRHRIENINRFQKSTLNYTSKSLNPHYHKNTEIFPRPTQTLQLTPTLKPIFFTPLLSIPNGIPFDLFQCSHSRSQTYATLFLLTIPPLNVAPLPKTEAMQGKLLLCRE